MQETQRIIAEPCKRSNNVEKACLSGGQIFDFLLYYSELGKRKIYWMLEYERQKTEALMYIWGAEAERIRGMDHERELSCF